MQVIYNMCVRMYLCVHDVYGLAYSPGGHIGQQLPLSGSEGSGLRHSGAEHAINPQFTPDAK